MGLGADEPKRKGIASRPILYVVGILALVALFPYCLVMLLTPLWRAIEVPIRQPGNVLLVTAHPDDETVFFGPAITALHSRGSEVYLLCLTTGSSFAWPVPAALLTARVMRTRKLRDVDSG